VETRKKWSLKFGWASLQTNIGILIAVTILRYQWNLICRISYSYLALDQNDTELFRDIKYDVNIHEVNTFNLSNIKYTLSYSVQ